MSLRRSLLLAGAVLVLAGLVGVGQRVLELERSELEHQSEPRSLRELSTRSGATRVSARLAEVRLERGDHAVFELCAADGLRAELWAGHLSAAIFQLEPLSLLLKVPLDSAHLAHARRNRDGGCVLLGRGPIERTARYSVDLVWPDAAPPAGLTEVPLRVRVLAKTPLGSGDRALLLALALGIALALGAGFVGRRGQAAPTPAGPRVVPAVAALCALVGITQLPLFGASLSLAKGMLLVAAQLGLAYAMSGRLSTAARASQLALAPPPRLWPWLATALVCGLALAFVATQALHLVPSTSEAPIETFISWPSGMLVFGSLGMLLPVAEEVFFRGYLYRVALRWGPRIAFAATLLAFVALHAQQSWGNWGGLLAIFITGSVLTTLRALSGSTLIPAAAHLLYNFTLSAGSF
jgi:membrane protease YdiL (CAAX protease family)